MVPFAAGVTDRICLAESHEHASTAQIGGFDHPALLAFLALDSPVRGGSMLVTAQVKGGR